jgi:hypothetical protein
LLWRREFLLRIFLFQKIIRFILRRSIFTHTADGCRNEFQLCTLAKRETMNNMGDKYGQQQSSVVYEYGWRGYIRDILRLA